VNGDVLKTRFNLAMFKRWDLIVEGGGGEGWRRIACSLAQPAVMAAAVGGPGRFHFAQ
jgi:hypothetical protein